MRDIQTTQYFPVALPIVIEPRTPTTVIVAKEVLRTWETAIPNSARKRPSKLNMAPQGVSPIKIEAGQLDLLFPDSPPCVRSWQILFLS